ncbi:deoxyribose-phosphate aldolase [Pendulispora brunnea]|uniref:Deoxyribose-phosphate aldolase n=1 Tax=Pendulispora brunnea TaxID=2905690 RepID=A0ABZ2K5J9_9BACT
MAIDIGALLETRARHPERIAELAGARKKRPLLGASGRLFIIAADHPARGALRIGSDPLGMGNRFDLLERLCTALARPGVDGVMATADVLEDLLLLGALEEKVVIGSMNRGGLVGASFELDDRFTGYDAETIARMGFDGGKMLVRIDRTDPGSVRTLEACARAVDALAARQRMAMVEPFMSHRVDGKLKNDLSTEAMIHAIAISSGLGSSSAYTWLKVPVVDDMERVMASSTLPALLLGGEGGGALDAAFERWHKALRLPTVRGLVVGRTLLYPSNGDVSAAVDTAAGLLPKETT